MLHQEDKDEEEEEFVDDSESDSVEETPVSTECYRLHDSI